MTRRADMGTRGTYRYVTAERRLPWETPIFRLGAGRRLFRFSYIFRKRGAPLIHIRDWIGLAAAGVEILAVVIVITAGMARWLAHTAQRVQTGYQHYRIMLAKALLVRLELLVAADIVRTVIIENTLISMATLGVLVAIRTFLGWSLSVEIEGYWPWQRPSSPEVARTGDDQGNHTRGNQ